MIYVNAVNEKGKGKVQIKYLGGPEIVARADAPMSAASGVVDMAYTGFTFYGGVVPIGNAMQLTELTGPEERASGLWDYVRELHAKAGLYWLGRGHSCMEAATYWNSVKPVAGINDLKGQRAGSGSLTSKSFVEKIGASFIQVQVGDVFTALERGVLDAYITPTGGQISAGAEKICKYLISHPFYRGNISIFMGLDKWNTLPKDVQDILMSVLLEKEQEMSEVWAELDKLDFQKCVDAGEKVVTFPEAEAKQYVDMAYEAAREDVMKEYPESGPKIIELSKKK